jgi:hydroxyacid-oxoacid transhydrogenase
MTVENIIAMHTSSIKYGFGATREVGYDMRRLGGQRVMVVADPNLSSSEPVSIAMAALQAEGMDAVPFEEVHIEPTDVSFKHAIAFAIDGNFDGYVAIGGGSTMDTAKVANLYATFPADFLAYVNHPIGEGRPVPGQLAPMIALPTTAGTGSETTGVAIFDFLDMHTKTGIAHPALRPALGIVDPDNTRTLPKMAVTCTGWDVLCHALESLTAVPFDERPAPEHPSLRPAYQGSNPISDVWAARAIELVSAYIVRAVQDPDDDEARAKMHLAACFAGIGFGNAGVHLPHGMSYPVSSLRHEHVVEGYPTDNPLIPHGMAVTLNAPAVFRFTGQVNPERHLYAAKLMGVDVTDTALEDAGDLLADTIIDLMKQTGMPNGLGAVGYKLEDVDALVAGTLPQHRVTKLSPRPAGAEELRQLFADSMTLW